MAVLSITIPDSIAPRVRDAFAVAQGYTGFRPDGQAETKAAFMQRKTREWIKEQARAGEAEAAARAARDAANADADANFTLS